MNQLAVASRRRRSPLRLAFVIAGTAIVALVTVVLVLPSAPPQPGSSLPFAANSVWNAPLPADAPLSPMSATYVSGLEQQVARYGVWINTTQYSVPVYTVGANQPRVPVTLDTHGGSADLLARELRQGVPIPPNAKPAEGTDQSMVVRQPSRNTLWEFWRARDDNGVWHARWGGKMTDVSSNPGYYADPSDWGGTATSLPLLGGLMRISELRARRIDHALALAIPRAAAAVFSFPAQRSDGVDTSPAAIPEGTRFRLDPRFDVNAMKLPTVTKIMALAAQRYGIIVRDQAGSVAFYAEDPGPTGSNPYSRPHGFFDGEYPSALMRYFPWSHLEVVRAPMTRR
jgi:hypothetical protein